MNSAQTSRHGLAALAMTGAFVALLGALTIAPHIGAHVAAKEIDSARAALKQLQRLAARGPALKGRAAAIRSSQTRLQLLLPGDTTGIAGAELQRFLLARTAHHGGRAKTVLVQPPQAEEGLVRISALLTVQIGIEGLRIMLHDLETGLPLLFVSELSVRGLEAAGATGTGLEVRMHVGGYVLAGREAAGQ